MSNAPSADMGISKGKLVLGIVLLVGTSMLLFVRLGHTPLWDDEATTALYGKSIWQTGDAYAVVGHNIVAFKGGAELRNLRNRYMPPLAFVVAAPFVGLLGDTSLAARLPFAVCGLLTLVVILRWLWRANADTQTWLLVTLGILGNVSLMLFARQCRYYALGLLLSVGLAYLYMQRADRRRTALTIGLLSVCLLASNYLSYAAFYACAAIDYLVWEPRSRRFSKADWLLVWTPQVVLGGLLLLIWNPFMARRVWSFHAADWLSDRVTLFWWNLRELNACEFGVGVLILACPLLYMAVRDRWLLRAPLALLVYVVAITLISPQPIAGQTVPTIRYLVPLIPLCIIIGVLAIRTVTGRRMWLAVPLAIAAFGTNLLHGGPCAALGRRTIFSDIVCENRLRSTVLDYVRELRSPPHSSYAAAVEWIRKNVEPGQSIWVLPNYAAYPLMFHAPHALYAWQLQWPPEPQFAGLDEIHFIGRTPPEFVMIFGPTSGRVQSNLLRQGYHRVETIDAFWADLIRPELFYHAFREVRDFDRSDRAIYVFRRTAAIARS